MGSSLTPVLRRFEGNMNERLNVSYQNQTICAYDLLDYNGQYIEEVRHELRIASQSGMLCCPDCKERMILCAGAIRQPYFRHFQLQHCQTGTELKTKSGQRKYQCRQLLYQFVKQAGFTNRRIDENHKNGLLPVLFDTEEGTVGYVYLDGKTRDYIELSKNIRYYKEQGIRLYLFLNIQFHSNSRNITSDEAECSRMNEGKIFYLDLDSRMVTIRKKYMDVNHTWQYYEESFSLDMLCPDRRGMFDQEFMGHYDSKVRKEKQKFKKVMRVSAENGIDEDYMEMDYTLMDSLQEIWVLPDFQYRTEGAAIHRENRLQFLEQQNLKMLDMNADEREEWALELCRCIENRRNSWDWG
ncbi:MAG: competence protein CoiA family protein [Eubacterium sp.]